MSKEEVQTITIEEREMPKTKTCELCGREGKTHKDVQLYAGGYVSWAHPECTKIGNKAIEQFFKSITYHPNGTNVLAEHLLKARGAQFFLNDLFKEKNELKETV